MTEEQIRATVLRLLGAIAPEADLRTLRTDAPLRDQVDIDSMDFLNLLIALDDELSVEISEADYGKLTTLDALVGYLAATLRKRTP